MSVLEVESGNIQSIGDVPSTKSGLSGIRLWAALGCGFLLVNSLVTYGVSLAASRKANPIGVTSKGYVYSTERGGYAVGEGVSTVGMGMRLKAKVFPVELTRDRRGLYRHGCMAKSQLQSLWSIVVGDAIKTTISMHKAEGNHDTEWALELSADGAHRNATHTCFSCFQATMFFCYDHMDTSTCVMEGGHGKFVTYPTPTQGAMAGHESLLPDHQNGAPGRE